VTVRHHVAVATLFLALAVVFTWPLAYNLRAAVVWPGDPYLNAWILDWDWWATWHQPLSLFEANTFYPAHHSLAYSENLYGIALVLFPFRAVGVPPLAAFNLAMLLGYAFSAFGAYLLARSVTRSTLAGVAAGIFYGFVPFRITQAAHVQHVWGGWLPVMLLALLHYARGPSWKRASLFAAAFLMNGLTNIHWLLFGVIAIAVTVAIVRPRLVPLAATTAVALLCLAPFLWPYAQVAKEYGMRRGWRETKSYSASPRDWLVSDPHSRFYSALNRSDVDPERWLFPGALSILLCVGGLFTRDRRALAVGGAWIVLGFIGSLGTHVIFHRFLFRYGPGFRAVRVPARWANIAYVGMALLIALGVCVIARERKWIAVAIATAFAIELWPTPMLWYLAIPDAPPVYRMLAEMKPHAILELPMTADAAYLYMLRSTEHHRPIVNGTSGFTPPECAAIGRLVDAHSPELVPALRRAGVDVLVFHADYSGDEQRAWLGREVAAGHLTFIGRTSGGIYGDWIFSTAGRAAPPQIPAELAAMLRGDATYNDAPFGFVDLPLPGMVIKDHRVYVSGFAFSPYGIREVNLLFQNHTFRSSAPLFEDPALRRRWPWYAATKQPRFQALFSTRPPGVRERTDLQVEIVDGRGQRLLLDDRPFRWP